MGDRWYLDLKCVYCGNLNKDVWYSPTSSCDVFKCEKCKKTNFITGEHKVKRIEDVTKEEIAEGFSMNTNIAWTEKQIDKFAKDRLKQLKF